MVRVGTIDDLPAVAAFDPFEGDRRGELAAGQCLVYEAAGTVVGYCTFSRAGFIGRPFVHFLAVAPAFRRHRIGVTLLGAAVAQVGPGRVFISTGDTNAVMKSILARERWTPAGCVAGVNTDGTAECFFYRDFGRPDAATA